MQLGSRLGPYEVVALIGAGGMGEVYRARDTRLDRDVAIKVLPAEFASDPELLRRFEQEARAVAALSHPHILALYDVGTHDGSPYLVTEVLEGEPLREHLSGGALPARKAVNLAVQLAQGLAVAHAKGIIHRDLKPENVFITKDGYVKILDFGIAKLVAPRSAEELARATTEVDATAAGAILGTVGYMSPEQVRGHTVDHRTDVFSFGCVLYEMLAGQAPFRRGTIADTTSAILHEDPPALPNGVSPGLDRTVRRCLEKNVENRYQSARDLGFDLQAEVAAATATSPVGLVPRPRRWLWPAVAALGVVLAAGGTGLLLVRGHSRAPSPLAQIRSLAVLPLANLSGDAAQEYFSEGMTEELTATLSKISALKVISRTSAMQFKGTRKPLREIAAALGVDGVIEGSVLRAGDRVRITAQLINAASDAHIWAESYERDFKDVLGLQSDVARAIASEVRAKLTPQEQTRLASARKVNPEAYDLYMKGLLSVDSVDESEYRRALDYFQRAIELDPTYAPPYAGVATYYIRGGVRAYQPPGETISNAKPALRRALELDEGLAEAHAALGGLMWKLEWDWSGADRELRRAIELDPNRSDSHAEYGMYLVAIARLDAGIAEYRRAVELDPLSPYKGFELGAMLYYARRYDESIAQLRKTLNDAPVGGGSWARMILGLNYAQKKMFSEAVSECVKALEKSPDDQLVSSCCGHVYGLAGRRQEALALVNRLKSLSPRRYADPYGIALIYDGLGDKDCTLEWLERSYSERSPNACSLGAELWTDRLRSDPRFQDLLRRMNYPASTNQ